jgi:hypothetical protein
LGQPQTKESWAKEDAWLRKQALLVRYVGWGGLAASFSNPETGKFRDCWAQRARRS